MKFAKSVFLIAGVYGLLLLPPPGITHPAFFYGFVGIAAAWLIPFLVVARDPVRFRPIMVAPSGQLDRLFPGRVMVMDPNDPTQAATEIVTHLKQAHMQQRTEKTFLALGAGALGLFVLASQD